ncbi:MAG: hypothetical protein WCI65_14815 [Synechococcaceae cyanobacterium ELA263]
MSTTVYLRHAHRLLEAALIQAQQERDSAVFEVARGERSLQQLLRLVERAALVRFLALQTQSLLSPESQPLAPLGDVVAGAGSQAQLYRHPRNTRHFQRLQP